MPGFALTLVKIPGRPQMLNSRSLSKGFCRMPGGEMLKFRQIDRYIGAKINGCACAQGIKQETLATFPRWCLEIQFLQQNFEVRIFFEQKVTGLTFHSGRRKAS